MKNYYRYNGHLFRCQYKCPEKMAHMHYAAMDARLEHNREVLACWIMFIIALVVVLLWGAEVI